jgi:hypothetical protein
MAATILAHSCCQWKSEFLDIIHTRTGSRFHQDVARPSRGRVRAEFNTGSRGGR